MVRLVFAGILLTCFVERAISAGSWSLSFYNEYSCGQYSGWESYLYNGQETSGGTCQKIGYKGHNCRAIEFYSDAHGGAACSGEWNDDMVAVGLPQYCSGGDINSGCHFSGPLDYTCNFYTDTACKELHQSVDVAGCYLDSTTTGPHNNITKQFRSFKCVFPPKKSKSGKRAGFSRRKPSTPQE